MFKVALISFDINKPENINIDIFEDRLSSSEAFNNAEALAYGIMDDFPSRTFVIVSESSSFVIERET